MSFISTVMSVLGHSAKDMKASSSPLLFITASLTLHILSAFLPTLTSFNIPQAPTVPAMNATPTINPTRTIAVATPTTSVLSNEPTNSLPLAALVFIVVLGLMFGFGIMIENLATVNVLGKFPEPPEINPFDFSKIPDTDDAGDGDDDKGFGSDDDEHDPNDGDASNNGSDGDDEGGDMGDDDMGDGDWDDDESHNGNDGDDEDEDEEGDSDGPPSDDGPPDDDPEPSSDIYDDSDNNLPAPRIVDNDLVHAIGCIIGFLTGEGAKRLLAWYRAHASTSVVHLATELFEVLPLPQPKSLLKGLNLGLYIRWSGIVAAFLWEGVYTPTASWYGKRRAVADSLEKAVVLVEDVAADNDNLISAVCPVEVRRVVIDPVPVVFERPNDLILKTALSIPLPPMDDGERYDLLQPSEPYKSELNFDSDDSSSQGDDDNENEEDEYVFRRKAVRLGKQCNRGALANVCDPDICDLSMELDDTDLAQLRSMASFDDEGHANRSVEEEAEADAQYEEYLQLKKTRTRTRETGGEEYIEWDGDGDETMERYDVGFHEGEEESGDEEHFSLQSPRLSGVAHTHDTEDNEDYDYDEVPTRSIQDAISDICDLTMMLAVATLAEIQSEPSFDDENNGRIVEEEETEAVVEPEWYDASSREREEGNNEEEIESCIQGEDDEGAQDGFEYREACDSGIEDVDEGVAEDDCGIVEEEAEYEPVEVERYATSSHEREEEGRGSDLEEEDSELDSGSEGEVDEDQDDGSCEVDDFEIEYDGDNLDTDTSVVNP
ncbi:hypothetical protein DXG01_004910 [Tephrocybe rancida]|nr:hypothetical protein DXG01_004910 [Tephrocybe rancida]